MDFREATDAYLAIGGTLAELAEQFGVARETVSRWRSETPGRYRPPDDWPAILSGAARGAAERRRTAAEEEAGKFTEFADKLGS